MAVLQQPQGTHVGPILSWPQSSILKHGHDGSSECKETPSNVYTLMAPQVPGPDYGGSDE